MDATPSMTAATVSDAVSPAVSKAYLEALMKGDRAGARRVIEGSFGTPRALLTGLIWPTMESLQALYKEDRVSVTSLNMATRLNRSIADSLSARLEHADPNGRTALIFCGNAEPEELGGQICSDLFESAGWTVKFAGGGVPDDEVLALIGTERPDLLVLFATLSSGVPAVRKLIDYLRDVNSCPNMQVMCAGGIYKRAEGLADEIGADLYAPDAAEAVAMADAHPTRRASVDQQTVGRTRRIRKAEARKGEAVQMTAVAA